MKSLIKYIFMAGVRDRIYAGLFLALFCAIALSIFLGSTSLIEKQQMTAVYIAGSTRAIMVLGMILFVCLRVRRSFENKEVEFIISKSISRQSFILGYLCGFLLTALVIFIPLALAIFYLTNANLIGLLAWLGSLFFELIITISFALLASLILKNPFSSIIAGFGFYIISRLMGMFLLAIKLPETLLQAKSHIFATFLKFISVFFPRLDLFGQSSWLNYGITNGDISNLKIILAQSLIYIPLLIFMAFHDFKKKQF